MSVGNLLLILDGYYTTDGDGSKLAEADLHAPIAIGPLNISHVVKSCLRAGKLSFNHIYRSFPEVILLVLFQLHY